MINEIINDAWAESIKEHFEETGLVGHFSALENVKPVDHNLINMAVDKQTKAIFREVFAEQIEMMKDLLKTARDAICSTMVEGTVRDAFSNYEFTPDDIDELLMEIMKDEEEDIYQDI